MFEAKLKFGMREGRPFHISQISKDENGKKCRCVCPECEQPLIARTLGLKRSAHFAHAGESNCQPETNLHSAAKFLIALKIDEAIAASRELPLEWKCKSCRRAFTIDLAAKVASTHVEKRLDSFVPDVQTRDEQMCPIMLIEVVHSNPPSDEKIEYARSRTFHWLR